MANPTVQVKSGAGAYAATTNGINAAAASSVVINLVSGADVSSWQCSCIYTDDTTTVAGINASLAIDNVAKTATFTAPAAGKALIFRSVVNGGLGPDGRTLASHSTTFGIFVLTAGGSRVIASNQTTESNSTHGWTADVNSVIRTPPGGGVVATAIDIAKSDGTTVDTVQAIRGNVVAAGTLATGQTYARNNVRGRLEGRLRDGVIAERFAGEVLSGEGHLSKLARVVGDDEALEHVVDLIATDAEVEIGLPLDRGLILDISNSS